VLLAVCVTSLREFPRSLAWSLCSLALAGDAGRLFRVGGVVIGLLTTFPALLLSFLEPRTLRTAQAVLLLAGGIAMASVDLSYIGWAEPWRVAFGYLMPAGLTATAAIIVAPARVRLVVPSSESVRPKPASP
jgi:hypothetical protein